jgi:BASS family bile acid:Na+ symporter
MNLLRLIPLDLEISIGLIVFCVALEAVPADLLYLARRPVLLVRSLLSMNVIMPIVAAAVALLFSLRREIEIALILLAVSPVPPVLPNKQAKAGGNVSYAVGLLATLALVAIVFVPLSVKLVGRLFGQDLHVPVAPIAMVVLKSILMPLVIGMVVRSVAPAFARRFSGPLSTTGTVLLLLGIVPVFFAAWPAIMALVGDGTLLAIVLFTVVALVVGHLLGGSAPEERSVLALSTATRHPGVAMAVASAVTPDPKPIAAAVLLAVLVSAVVAFPYVKWSARRVHAASTR